MLNRLLRVEAGEWPKLLRFGLFGLLLQAGLGVGFSAGDAAFLTHVGPGQLPVIFLLTPVVMALYTAVYSVLQVRLSPGRVIDLTLGFLIVGGAAGWALLSTPLPKPWALGAYYALKLYLAMWYIGLYSLFWTFVDGYFDIQDAKRLFPLFAAFCALGAAIGALAVGALAKVTPLPVFLLIWAGLAALTLPVARNLQNRFVRIAETDADLGDEPAGVGEQLRLALRAFRTSRYAALLTAALFVTLLLTNLAEFRYSTVLQAGRTEQALARLFGGLYAAAGVFNVLVCLFAFNRLVTRFGVRNVALVLPVTYFAVFAGFFLAGGEWAALGAFFAYHGVLTSIDYNNQNLLFNATPSAVRRPFRTIVEGMAEPLASLVSGAALLTFARHMDSRELSGVGVLAAAGLVAVVVALRQAYPAAMEANMRRGWLNFGDPAARTPAFDESAAALLRETAQGEDSGLANAARVLLARQSERPAGAGAQETETSDATAAFAAQLASPSATVRRNALHALVSVVGPGDVGLTAPLIATLPRMDRDTRAVILDLLGRIGDVEAIPQILAAAAQLSPRELRAAERLLVGMGDVAIPRLMQALGDARAPYRSRAVAARALAALSPSQFLSQLERLVDEELSGVEPRVAVSDRLDAEAGRSVALQMLAQASRERIAAAVDFVLELLALGGQAPDFDLLIVSLHSVNPKVRGNAIEAVASGVAPDTYRRLEPLIQRRRGRQGAAAGDLPALLAGVIADGTSFEAVAAAQALSELLPPEALPALVRPALKPGLDESCRRSLAALLSDGGSKVTVVDVVAALQAQPVFGAAAVEPLMALAARTAEQPFGRRPVEVELPGGSVWLSKADIDDVAARYPELALAMLRAQDRRADAA